MKHVGNYLIAVIVAILLLNMTVYAVDQREYALVFRLGEIVTVHQQPGLHFKLPLIESVRYFDRRIVTLDWGEPDRYITSEKKNVLVDSYVKWRIVDPKLYYVSVRGDSAQAEARLAQLVNDGLRAEFGRRTIHDVVSGERDTVMDTMRYRADKEARNMGIQVIDVRLKRVDLTEEVSESVYHRMEAERKRVANDLRSRGAGAAEQIRADADKQREIILAEAYSKAQSIKGSGDGEAAHIYAQAYGQDAEFYAFYRSLEAYRKSFKDKRDLLILQPNSDFFKYLRGSSGKN